MLGDDILVEEIYRERGGEVSREKIREEIEEQVRLMHFWEAVAILTFEEKKRFLRPAAPPPGLGEDEENE